MIGFSGTSHKSGGDGRASVTDSSASRSLSNYNDCPKISTCNEHVGAFTRRLLGGLHRIYWVLLQENHQ